LRPTVGFVARRPGAIGVALLVMATAAPLSAAERTLDDFETLTGWTATGSPGTAVEIAQDSGHEGKGMRIDFDFTGNGFAFVRKEFKLPLPRNYAFTFWLRGDALPNDFQFKLVGPTGNDVWWKRQPGFHFPAEWQHTVVRKTRLEFAWGPSAGAALQRTGAIEFAIASSEGGKGSIWIDDLRFEERRPPLEGGPVHVQTSTSLPGHEPALALDGNPQTAWRSGTVANDQWMVLDFGDSHEYGGLVIDWDADDYARAYTVETSDDEQTWTPAHSSELGNGGRDYIYLPEAESRFLRIHMRQSSRAQGYAITHVVVKPFEFSVSANAFVTAIAAESPPGVFPKYFSGKQTYWTVVGAEHDDRESLINEEGTVEVAKGTFSIEPFLYVDGKLVTWHDVSLTQGLQDGYLPIPWVEWHNGGLKLRITAFAGGETGSPALYLRYRVRNEREQHERVSLFLTVRPFQVNPPWQSLNMVGGVSRVRKMEFDGRTVHVDGKWSVVSPHPPVRFGAVTFEGGPLYSFLTRGEIPPEPSIEDRSGFASGVLHYDLELPPGGEEEVILLVPHDNDSRVLPIEGVDVRQAVDRRQQEVADGWRRKLGRVEFALPPMAAKLIETAKTSVAYMLINRDGASLQPGSRNYSRSWIRDGAMTSGALLEMGFASEVRAFLDWFARYQADDGRVPCCVDWRGVDPVQEHDSYGQFIYGVAEYYRHTRDVGFVSDMWPHIVGAVNYIAMLRQLRTTEEYRQPERNQFFGLLPESISHEGYSSRPVHSYWDDFFALRGLKDAVMLGGVVGDRESAERFAVLRDEFDDNLRTSVNKSMRNHDIDFIPGSVELGDFDPTSTTVLLLPGGEFFNYEPALSRTFERYWDYFVQRRAGEIQPDAYTPYELRSVGALVHLGQRQRALEVLDFLMDGQRPAAWNEWAEVVWRDRDLPRFIGDMPHTWVASGFVRSLRTMLAYERDDGDDALVIAAGVPAIWLEGGNVVGVKRLPTHFGVLHYSLRIEGDNRMIVRIDGDLEIPAGKIELRPPLPRPLRAVSINSMPVERFTPDMVIVGQVPADIVLEY
jgi:hypothetical protein